MVKARLFLAALVAILFTSFAPAAHAGPIGAQIDAATSPPGCDPIDPEVCLLPWPNDYFTREDATTATGKRLNLLPTTTPRNVAGKPIDVTELNRHDGFSPGSAILTKVPGLNTQQAFDRTGLVPESDMARAFDANQPVVVIDADTLQRQLVWAELDFNASRDKDRVLIIRPGRNWLEGHRYIVALRNLRQWDGTIIQPNPVFKSYRDRGTTLDPNVEARRPHMESIFATLGRAGIARSNLYQAWDFTIASEKDRSERILTMRDTAFAELGDTNLADLTVQGSAPPFTVDSVTDQSDGRRKITGTFTVPCFLDKPGCVPGSRFAFAGPTATVPTRIPGNTQSATYTCYVPTAAINGGPSTRPSLYGHGLLGGQGEVGSGPQKDMVVEQNMTYCATDWYGFATEDIGSVAVTLLDVSNFPLMVDRMQQGMLDFMVLGRLAVHPDGFSSNPAFQRADGSSVIDRTRLYYDGNSQGGIMGGALIAVEPDAERATLGVPAMNYSTLLQRSVDFESDPANPCPPTDPVQLAENLQGASPDDPESFLEVIGFSYACPLYASYPVVKERQLILGLMQQLWDRGEADGYAQHMTSDPYPNTPPHEVLMHAALGDHQVANVAAEVEARTIGARAKVPMLFANRPQHLGQQLLAPIPGYPFDGSAMTYWDIGPVRDGGRGVGDPPTDELPNRAGRDPHSAPRNDAVARQQKAAFLRPDGRVVDVCGGQPCGADGWTGP
jgi:hypothetical protein